MVQDRGPATSAVTIIVTAVATAFVAARFFTRIRLVRSIRQDDWWILAAWVCAVGFSSSIRVAVHYGLGKHKQDIPDSSFSALRKAEYTFAILYNPSLMLTKTSIIVFFLSVMSKDVDPVFKWCNWLTLAVVNLVGLALTFFNIFQCSPVAAGYLYPTPENAACTDIVTLYLSSAPLNIITDIAILFLPIPILTGMRLPRKQKIILVATFSFGAFVAAIDVIRIAYLQQAALNRLKVVKGTGSDPGRTVEDNDFSWYASLSFMWSAVEVCIGLVCACVPSLKPLFARFLPSFIKDAGEELTSDNSVDAGNPRAGTAGTKLPKGNVSMLNNPAAFRRPIVQEYCGDDQGDQMGFLNMLAWPPEEQTGSPLSRTATKLSRRHTNKSTVSDFGFVNMSGKRNMLNLSNRESAWPIAVVTVIFFLWGFAYGLLDTLNSRFQLVAGVSTGKGLGLHSAYYGGYFVGPLSLGRFIIKRYGFKALMIAGLAVYGCGTLVFWPSAVLTSYAAFTVSNFIVGFGLSCLEVAANPYIALCGPLEFAEVRLNLSQAFQAIGTVCSPLLATKVLFKSVNSAGSLVDVQMDVSGDCPLRLEDLADRRGGAYLARLGPWKVVYVTLGLGVFSQFCYVGAQECVGNNVQPLFKLLKPTSTLQPFDYQMVGHGVFAFGRFLATFLNYFLKPRWILLGSYVGVVVCLALDMHLDGNGGAAVPILTLFFEAGIFSIIFAIAMRGLGKHTKTGASLMTAAISGGAVFPPIQWAVANGHGLKYSYCVPLAVAVSGTLFAVYLNLVPQAKSQVDPIHETRSKRRTFSPTSQESVGTVEQEKATGFGAPGIVGRRKRDKRSKSPSVQHVERQSTNLMVDGGAASPVLAMDFADVRNPHPSAPSVQPKPAKGYVADLALWPAQRDPSKAHASSNSGHRDPHADDRNPNRHSQMDEDLDMTITRHRPRWENRDPQDDLDDYHAVMKSI
ncbi:putative MFS transporter [Cladophialophora carrionii]|uniref:Putative MFS transporter n=1 Tax=Cladophialophora carrionii TaxID=86049 RepID=A0A1C1CSR5_9EURO|nr:putative MFS transporter [Cladophialophora carrionii]